MENKSASVPVLVRLGKSPGTEQDSSISEVRMKGYDQQLLTRAADSIKYNLSSSYFNKSEFKF